LKKDQMIVRSGKFNWEQVIYFRYKVKRFIVTVNRFRFE
jgi:hypothetical protein